ncbi:hypothetical protein TNCV_4214641 [Trichonephila clavipes]|nr:hypothetical protein TNCV_4214641 [Trichonephila clavipes]
MSMTSCNRICCHSCNGSHGPFFNKTMLGLTTVTRLSPHCYYPSLACLIPDLSPIEHICDLLGWRVGHSTSLNEIEQGYRKYGTKCLKTSYRTCMPQCPIVWYRAR